MTNRTVAMLCAGILGLMAAATAQDREMKPRFMKVGRVDTAPAVDGVLGDACWRDAEPQTGFYRHKTTEPADRRTSMRMCYDNRALYIGVECEDETREQTITERTERDDPGMWRDSTVEIFLKPDPLWPQLLMVPPEEQHVHIILNAAGVQYDQLGTQSSAAWSGNWTSAVTRTDTGWTAEIAIPFSVFELAAPDKVSLWKAQVARNAQGPRAGATWSPTGAIYREQGQFGALVFVPDDSAVGNIEREAIMQLRIKPAMDEVAATLQRLDALRRDAKPDGPDAAAIAGIRERVDSFKSELADENDEAFLADWQERLSALAELAEAAHAVARDVTEHILAERDVTVALYPWPAITNEWITPFSLPDPARVFQPVSVRACPGEFESATFVIYSPAALENVAIEVPPARCGTNALSADAVDVRVVTCWYQKAPTSIGGGDTTLLPELLLKDPGLVAADLQARENRITHYGMYGHPGDADSLQPFSVPARSARQIWLTVRPPADAAPGVYTTDIAVSWNGGGRVSIPLSIEVLDFALEPSLLDHGFYNVNHQWGTQDEGRVRAEMRNLADHGVTHMFVRDKYTSFARVVPMMREEGLHTDRLFTFGFRLRHNHETGEIEPIDEFRKNARAYIEAGKAAGAKDVYIYLIDEATGDLLARQRPYAEAVHELGGKTATACNTGFFNLAGDFIDAPIVASAPMPRDMVDALHAKGARVYSYANPQCGLELPETYRRNFGLLLWQAGYDGSMDFAWYWPFNNIWNDFDHPSYKDHNMVYPTKTGVIDTIQWEGWREGADDCRYMATLLKAINEATDADAAQRARAWVDELRTGGGEQLADLDGVRTTMIAHIRACRGK